MSDEEESGGSVQFSDTSDVDSPSPSAVCTEHVSEDDDVASDKSSSTNCSSVSRCKKRVMFKSDDNLVLIREIPPRGFYSESDTDTAAESDEFSDEKSDQDESDEEDEDNDSLGLEKCEKIESKNTATKGRYDVGKASSKNTAKVAHITGATIDNADNKKTTKKKVVRRTGTGKKSPPLSEIDKTSKTMDKSKSSKAKQQGTRSKLAKKVSDKIDKNSNKINTTKPKSKFEKRCKSAPPTLERTSPMNASRKSDKINGFYGISNMCANVIRTTTDNQPKCVLSPDEKLWRLFDCSGTTDRDISARKKIIESSDFNSNTYVTEGENSVCKPSTHSYSNGHRRQDVNAMSATDRRLYSWLMANGNIPNPQQESPSIAPLWESSHSVITDVVKAPT